MGLSATPVNGETWDNRMHQVNCYIAEILHRTEFTAGPTQEQIQGYPYFTGDDPWTP